MRRVACIAVILAIGACTDRGRRIEVAPDAAKTVTPPRGGESDVLVEDQGMSVVRNKLTFAAAIRNPTGRDLANIELSVDLEDTDGRRIRSFTEIVPFCPARSNCWWGGLFDGRDFGDRWREIGRIQIAVISDDGHPGRPPKVAAFDVLRDDRGTVRGRAPMPEGMAVVVGFDDGRPRSGIAINIEQGMGFGRRLVIPSGIFPAVSGQERLRGFMYGTDVPHG